MSCGRNHSVPCTEILSALFLYIDHEIDDVDRIQAIEIHLQECPPCEQSVLAERRVRDLLARCCGPESTPDVVRDRVVQRLTEIRLQLSLEPPQ